MNNCVTKSIRIEKELLEFLYEKYNSKNFSNIIKNIIQEMKNNNSFKNDKAILKELDNVKFNQEIILNMLNSFSIKEFENRVYFGDKILDLSLNFSESLQSEKNKLEEKKKTYKVKINKLRINKNG